MSSKMLFFDTETTGLHPGNICQLSYIITDNDDVQAKNFFFTVDYVDPGAKRVHGLSVEKLRKLSNNKRFKDYFNEIRDDFDSVDIIAGHNVTFDIKFIKAEFDNCNYSYDYKESLCTMKDFTSICKITKSNGKGYKWPKLEELTSFFDIKHNDIVKASQELFKMQGVGFHDARYDIAATYLCYSKAERSGLLGELAF